MEAGWSLRMPKSTPPPTLKHVAALAQVSVSTASVALSGRLGNSRISSACIERVRQAASTLGYAGNYHAGALRSGRSQTIGVASGAGHGQLVGSRFWTQLGNGIGTAASAAGYDLILFGGELQLDAVERGLHLLETQRIDGLLLHRSLYPQLPQRLRRARQPVVVIFGQRGDPPHVQFDPAPGLEAALEHLQRLGHRRLAWLGTTGFLEAPHRERSQLLVEAARARGMSLEIICVPEDPAFGTSYGHSVMSFHRPLADFKVPRGVTAALCVNDTLALALLNSCARLGISCPGQLSIIGFDDLLGDATPLPLTTVSHQLKEIGEQAVRLLIRNLASDNPQQRQRAVLVPSTLVVGGTTGPAPA